ncbi:hypothetical protein VIGAN_11181300 [Vigna angularis var. angularis]|uniref:Plastocyanin-like domain-containing protein n=1 Tax=Vigna angularis var. angularis TaxID=157739 RepID=A0A0S3TAZ8_PHAAN|nr:hypothetical protein VIGAN_11181300 [Vigna angularis var. angularis]
MKFRKTLIFSFEEGTIWWHAHSDWLRATVYGVIYVYPTKTTPYPFPQPDAEIPVIFVESNSLYRAHSSKPNSREYFLFNYKKGMTSSLVFTWVFLVYLESLLAHVT